MEPDVLNGRELAAKLGVNERSLRSLIREHKLAGAHRSGEHYAFDVADRARIAAHPAVRRLIETTRGR